MRPFSFQAPTAVTFGDGVRHLLPERLMSGRWGVLSSPSVRARSGIAEPLDACSNRGIEIVSLGDVSPNPRLSEVESALATARDQHVEGILAVGGGSVIDAAKLLRVALTHDSSGEEALDQLVTVVERPMRRSAVLIAVPTTAGTGAEVSRGSIVTDHAGVKRAARGAALVPDVALVDPELTHSLPRQRTAETGFDVVAHAVETFLSRAASPVTDILARAALAAVPTALMAALEDPDDRSARRVMALHSWLMGYNLAHASTCLPHRLQYPIGSATDTSHQIGLAALYPAWFGHVAAAAPERATEVCRAISEVIETSRGAGTAPDEAMAAFLERLGIRVGLADLGLSGNDVADLAGAVTGRTDLDPIQPNLDTITAILRASVDA